MKIVMVFVKNPEKGKVKTRLAATVGEERALAIYKALLEHTKQVTEGVAAARWVWYSEQIEAVDMWPTPVFDKHLQHGADLGERMTNAFEVACRQGDSVVIIGSDCAQLTSEIVEDAFRQLIEKDVVIGPAEDGGYYLLGMRAYHPGLFQGIVWSTESVLQQTLKQAERLGLDVALLPTLSDIDYEEDWKKHGWALS